MIEASEADFRRALKLASVDLRDIPEHQALLVQGTRIFRDFLEDAVKPYERAELDFKC